MFASNGEATPPCGVPRVAFFPPLIRRFPRSSVSTTGAFSHILISCSIWPSLMRRATHVISAECGIVSKYFDRSASTTSVCPSSMARETWRTASSALRFGRYPYAASSKSASKIGSSTSIAAVCTTRSRMVGMPSGRWPTPLAFGIITRRTGCGV